MIVRFNCSRCGSSAKAEVDTSKLPDWVSPHALAIRVAVRRLGWRYQNGRIGKSVITMVCVLHGDPMHLDGDIDPAQAMPGTYEDDCAIEVDTAPSDDH